MKILFEESDVKTSIFMTSKELVQFYNCEKRSTKKNNYSVSKSTKNSNMFSHPLFESRNQCYHLIKNGFAGGKG